MNAMRHWVMGAGLFLLLGAFVHETVAQDRLPIIDMHMHPGTVTLTVAAMERYNIVLGFLSGDRWTTSSSGWKPSRGALSRPP
ncbi:MAG: hypothetical protein IH787_08485 [Nitrospirae bacterium]|nr:hypothetical protein [Nitrospirota bacterium]